MEQTALCKLAFPLYSTDICFYLLLKYFPDISYGTAFEDSREPQLENSFFEVPHLFICCQMADSLHPDILDFPVSSKSILFDIESIHHPKHIPPSLSLASFALAFC